MVTRLGLELHETGIIVIILGVLYEMLGITTLPMELSLVKHMVWT